MRRLPLALIAFGLVATPALADMVTVTPAQIGEIFCISRIGNDDGILSGVLSDELRTLIDYAEARNDTIATRSPDEKPPLGDGIPWASWPDYAPGCSIGSVAVDGKVARVVVQYAFPENAAADFSDTLQLRSVPHPHDPATGIWRLDNVFYTSDGDLRQALDRAFEGY